MHFAHGTAHEAALLGRTEDDAAVQQAAPHHDAVIERHGRVELCQVRADHARRRRQEFLEAAGIEDGRDALARRQFQVAAHGVPPVSVSAAWSSRRLTTAGVAPMSLMQMRASARPQRSWKSVMTACHVAPKPTAAVRTSISQAPPRLAGSISTSRLPEPTTPTSWAMPASGRLPCSNLN